jgi:hypothetical protein
MSGLKHSRRVAMLVLSNGICPYYPCYAVQFPTHGEIREVASLGDFMTASTDEIVLNVLMLSLSAKGLAALGLVVPVALLIAAVAWRIVRR